MQTLTMLVVAQQGGQIEQIARTFGVDWPHLIAQMVSFAIVCLILYAFAYKPILRMLEARRQQISDGLANAEQIKARLAEIESERQGILAKTDAESRELIEAARAAAARVLAEEKKQAVAAAEQVMNRAREQAARERADVLAELKHEFGRLVVATTGTVTGKILTDEDQFRLAQEAARQLVA